MKIRMTISSAGVILVFGLLASGALASEGLVDIDVAEKPLAVVVRFLAERGGSVVHFGLNRDGLPLAEDDGCRVTLKLEGVHWETALKLAADKAGAQIRKLENGEWFLFQPPSYALVLEDADLATVVTMVATLGNLNVVFNPEVMLGRRVTMRLSNLSWRKVLEVVVKTAGLALVVDAGDARPRIERLPEKDGEKAQQPSGAEAGREAGPIPRLRVTTILFRRDGGRSMAVVNGVTLQEGDRLPSEALRGYTGTVKEAVLEKVLSERLVRVRIDGKTVDVSVQGR